MDFAVINLELVATLLLLLLIGIGPKIALVPFLEKTKKFMPDQQVAIGRRMVITAVVAAVVVFITGGLLLRLLHITTGAVAVAGGIILALIAVKMALGSEEVVEHHEAPADPDKLAVYPLAIPYLFNPVGITVLIIASDSVPGKWGEAYKVLSQDRRHAVGYVARRSVLLSKNRLKNRST